MARSLQTWGASGYQDYNDSTGHYQSGGGRARGGARGSGQYGGQHGWQSGSGGASRGISTGYEAVPVERDDEAEFEASPLKRQADELEALLLRAVEAIRSLPRLPTPGTGAVAGHGGGRAFVSMSLHTSGLPKDMLEAHCDRVLSIVTTRVMGEALGLWRRPEDAGSSAGRLTEHASVLIARMGYTVLLPSLSGDLKLKRSIASVGTDAMQRAVTDLSAHLMYTDRVVASSLTPIAVTCAALRHTAAIACAVDEAGIKVSADELALLRQREVRTLEIANRVKVLA